MVRDFISLTAAQTTWKAEGLYRVIIDGRWGGNSAAADAKLPWIKAAQIYWKTQAFYAGAINGIWGQGTEKAHRLDAARTQSRPVDETNAEQWVKCEITDPTRFTWAVAGAKRNRGRYEALGDSLGVPWWFIAAIHCRECSYDFKQHLHNGDPLTARTRHVPAGRPTKGNPPFAWEVSAADALAYDGFTRQADWGIAIALDRLERYNGLGYQKRGLPSPYIFAGTNQYIAGKYIADGVFDADYVDRQPGCAGIIKLLL